MGVMDLHPTKQTKLIVLESLEINSGYSLSNYFFKRYMKILKPSLGRINIIPFPLAP